MNGLMPFFMVFATDRSRQQELLRTAVMPSFLMNLNPQQSAISVVTADQQIRSQRRDEETLVGEVTDAVARAARNQSNLPDAELQALPQLNRVLSRNQALRQQIDGSAKALRERLEDNLAEEAHKLVKHAIGLTKNEKLAKADLDRLAPRLGPAIERSSTLDLSDIIK